MKSIFELSNEDIKKLEPEFRNTSYFKKYMMCYTSAILILFLGFVFLAFVLFNFVTADLENIENPFYSVITTLTFVIGCTILLSCAALISVIFKYKKLDLMKQYYNEKSNK